MRIIAKEEKGMISKKGFTIIEVLLVVIIISILAGIVIPRFTLSTIKSKVQACAMNKALINKQVEAYYFDMAEWPATDLNDFYTRSNWAAIQYFPDGLPTCPVNYQQYTIGAAPERQYRVTGHDECQGDHTFYRCGQ